MFQIPFIFKANNKLCYTRNAINCAKILKTKNTKVGISLKLRLYKMD